MTFTMVAREEATVERTELPNGSARSAVRYFGGRSSADPTGPDAFISYLQNTTLGAHFHPVDQFQILVHGPGGKYQETVLPPMMLHYADAYSTYGPLIGEDPPMHFFTLRSCPSAFIAFMPGSRERMRWRGRRNWHVGFEHLGPTDFPPPGGSRVESVWGPEVDGMEAFALIGGPNTELRLPDTKGTNGQYVFVGDGEVDWDGHRCGFESLGWQDRDEPSVSVTTLDQGARLFVLRFPRPSTIEQHGELEKAGAS
jgi:hypothetical protein